MKKAKNVQIAIVQPRTVLSFCLIFCQFQPGVFYEVLLLKKACDERQENELVNQLTFDEIPVLPVAIL